MVKHKASTRNSKRSGARHCSHERPAERCRQNPWLRLAQLASSAFLAVLIGRIANNDDITLVVIIFGGLASGLISEKTLLKIWLRNRKK
jgi:hypothetical protein